MEEMKTVMVNFESLEDFRNRIQALWTDQPDDVMYDFVFPDQETEREFILLVQQFSNYGQESG